MKSLFLCDKFESSRDVDARPRNAGGSPRGGGGGGADRCARDTDRGPRGGGGAVLCRSGNDDITAINIKQKYYN